MPDVSLTGEDVNPNAARTDEKKSSSLTKCQKILFFVFKLFTNVSEKGKKKEKKEKKSVYALQRERRSLFFFFFFGSVDPAEVAAYVTGTVSVETHEKVRKHEQEGKKRRIRGKKKHEKGIRNEYVGCHVAASPDLKTKTSQAQRLMQPLNLLRLDDNKL